MSSLENENFLSKNEISFFLFDYAMPFINGSAQQMHAFDHTRRLSKRNRIWLIRGVSSHKVADKRQLFYTFEILRRVNSPFRIGRIWISAPAWLKTIRLFRNVRMCHFIEIACIFTVIQISYFSRRKHVLLICEVRAYSNRVPCVCCPMHVETTCLWLWIPIQRMQTVSFIFWNS